MRMRTIIILCCAVVIWGLAPSVEAQGVNPELRQRLAAATVYIENEIAMSPADWAALPEATRERIGRRPSTEVSGSGFLITPDGYLLTNAHVIDGLTLRVNPDGTVETLPGMTKPVPPDPSRPGQPFTLRFVSRALRVAVESGEETERELVPAVVRVNRNLDLAILKLTDEEPFEYLELDPEDKIEAGRRVLMVGFPGGKTPDIAPFADESNLPLLEGRNPRVSINMGMVSSVRRYADQKRYQLDIRANHGNSGGPIADGEGRVVGVLYAGIDSMESINYAIPIGYAAQAMPHSLLERFDIPPEVQGGGEQSWEEFLESGEFKFGRE